MNATNSDDTCACGDTPLAIVSSVIGILTFAYALLIGMAFYIKTAKNYEKDVGDAAAAFNYCQRRFQFLAKKLEDREQARHESFLSLDHESQALVDEGFKILAEHQNIAQSIWALSEATMGHRLLRALNWADKNSELLSKIKRSSENLSALQDQLLYL